MRLLLRVGKLSSGSRTICFPLRWDIWLGSEAPDTLWDDETTNDLKFLWIETREQLNPGSIIGGI